MNNSEAESEISGKTRCLKDLILFCLLLPVYYEFTKDIIVWQWMISGVIKLEEDGMTEKVYREYFDTLVDMKYFVRCGHDHYFLDQTKYKIGDRITASRRKQPLECKFGKYSDISCTNEIEFLSLTFKDISSKNLEVLKQYGGLQSLVIQDSYGVDRRLPCNIFSELKALKILNLSGTNIAALPSSIESLKELRFLDLSRTPISRLPDTIDSCSHLQILNLDNCLKLNLLPDSIVNLIDLQHLILDVRRLEVMPVGIGKLSNLETLNAFLVGLVDIHCIRELKDMNKLKGSLRLLNLKNVQSKEDALEACLYMKVYLKNIDFIWRGTNLDSCCSEEEILESLRPPMSIQDLKIYFYSGEVFPSWICDPSFAELETITLAHCKICWSLPSLGELPSLKVLSIFDNYEVVEIDSSFFRKKTNEHEYEHEYRVAFPKLEKLSIMSMSKLEKWSGLENGDFPCLRHLVIQRCPKVVGVSFLPQLNSLLHLEIGNCPELSADGLPPSLKTLMIRQTPKLEAQCSDAEWEGWSKVARVPTIRYF